MWGAVQAEGERKTEKDNVKEGQRGGFRGIEGGKGER